MMVLIRIVARISCSSLAASLSADGPIGETRCRRRSSARGQSMEYVSRVRPHPDKGEN
jgi:hypothetical protein